MRNRVKSTLVFSSFYLLMGCSSGPNKSEAINLAYSYLNNMVPGIEKNEISILKSHEKDGDIVVTVQAGGMLCDMPTIKGKDGWIARGINCNGQFESQEKAAIRSKKYYVKKTAENVIAENKKCPFINDKGVRVDKISFDESKLVVKYNTTINVNSTEATTKAIDFDILNNFSLLCESSQLSFDFNQGITFQYVVSSLDGKNLYDISVNKESCNKFREKLQSIK